MKNGKWVLLSLLPFVSPLHAEIAITSSLTYDGENPTNQLLLSWEAIPGKQYNVLTTTALGGQPWQVLNPTPVGASNNLGKFHDTNSQSARFYKVVKLDTDPPEIWRLSPGSNAIAVSRQSALKVYFHDETGVDPNSVALTLGTNSPVTLADPRMVYMAGMLTYTPATNEFLGTNGERVLATIAVSDTLGHRATNTWPFKVELTTILASNVALITSNSPLSLVSTNGDTYVFSYTGGSSGVTRGAILVSTDANFPYKRTVLSITDYPADHIVSLVTTQATLADILIQGSLRFDADDFFQETKSLKAASDDEGFSLIDFSGNQLYNQNDVLVQVTSGHLFFKPSFSIASEFSTASPFDLGITASLEIDLTISASWNRTGEELWSFDKDTALADKRLITTPKLVWIPVFPGVAIPVIVVPVWEFDIGVEGSVSAQGSFAAGLQASMDLSFGAQLRNGAWEITLPVTLPPAKPYPVTWEGGGTVTVRAYVEPKLTALLDGLIGPSLNVRPYLEVQGNGCVQPGEAGEDVAVYYGLNGNLAIDAIHWFKDWPDLPSTRLFDLRSPKPIFHKNFQQSFTTPVGKPLEIPKNMVWIPCGTFTMGSPATEAERDASEGPQTLVTISQGFWMGKYEVTQGEYASVMGNNPSWFNGDRSGPPLGFYPNYGIDLSRPVEEVSWDDAVAYCSALTQRERLSGRLPAGYVYRLPTEAEWEYACRAGTTSAFHYGPKLEFGMANFLGFLPYDSAKGTHYLLDGYGYNDPKAEVLADMLYLGSTESVGNHAPNAWGLFDMHGNVAEWCQDWWSGSLPGGTETDPQGSITGSDHVIRGGSWGNDAWSGPTYPNAPAPGSNWCDITTGAATFCRSAYRTVYQRCPFELFSFTDKRCDFIGFRVVLARVLP